jgi:hypothetical protein
VSGVESGARRAALPRILNAPASMECTFMQKVSLVSSFRLVPSRILLCTSRTMRY